METKYVKLETIQILNIPNEYRFKANEVLLSWNEQEQLLTISPAPRKAWIRLPWQTRTIPNNWHNYVFPLTAKERREIRSTRARLRKNSTR